MSRGGCLSGGLQSKCGEFRLQFPDRHSPRTACRPHRASAPHLRTAPYVRTFLATLDPDDAEPFLEMSPRLVPETWERFRDHALPGIRAVDEDAVERPSARYVLDPVPEEAGPRVEAPALILTGRSWGSGPPRRRGRRGTEAPVREARSAHPLATRPAGFPSAT